MGIQKYTFPDAKPELAKDILDAGEKNGGWLHDTNKTLLQHFVQPHYKLILEFGTWLGKSARFMANIARDAKIVCVDHWNSGVSIGTDSPDPEFQKVIDNNYELYLTHCWEYRKRFHPMRMDGKEAMRQLHDMGLHPDLIYLDMDHEYETVYEDLRLIYKYFPNVIVVGDDYMFHVGVCKAVHQVMNFYSLPSVEYNGNCFAIQPGKQSQKNKFYNFKLLTDYKKASKVAVIFAVTKEFCDEKYLEYIHERYGTMDADLHVVVASDKDRHGVICTGSIFNIGYSLLKDKYDTYVFHDPEMYPVDVDTLLATPGSRPVCVGSEINNYWSPNLGTIICTQKQFEELRGFPNYLNMDQEQIATWNLIRYFYRGADKIHVDCVKKYCRYNMKGIHKIEDYLAINKTIPHYRQLDKQSWDYTKYEHVEDKKYKGVVMHCCRIQSKI